MKTRYVAILAMLAVPFFAACGGSVCDDAADICAEAAGEGEGEGEEAECSGQAECVSQCVVDEDSCDFTNEALATCITDCGSA